MCCMMKVPTTPPAPFQPTPGLVTMTLTGAITPDEGVLSDATDREGNLDFWPQVARIAATTASSDLTICHLTDAEAPHELLIAMAFAGFDRCSNPAGPPLAVGDTIADTPDFDVNGVVVAHLAYSGSLSAEEITSDAAAERDAGAEVVVVTIEWGGAADLLPTAAERTLVQEITSTGAIDLVVGQSLLLRGVEQVNGVWVLWGLGGLLTSGQPGGSLPPAAEDAAISADVHWAMAVAFDRARKDADADRELETALRLDPTRTTRTTTRGFSCLARRECR